MKNLRLLSKFWTYFFRLTLGLFLTLAYSCSHSSKLKVRGPAQVKALPIKSSIALGNIKGEVFFLPQSRLKESCIEVHLKLKGLDKNYAELGNWDFYALNHSNERKIAQIKSSQSGLLVQERNIASTYPQGGNIITPYGQYEEWKQRFQVCLPGSTGDYKSFHLLAKKLPYKSIVSEELVFNLSN